MASASRAATVKTAATNVVRLRDWQPAPSRTRLRGRRAPLIAAFAISVLAHAVALQLLRAPAIPEVTPPRRIDVVLVQPPVPLPAVAAAPAPDYRHTRERARTKPAPPQQLAAARVPTPALAVQRDESAQLAAPAVAVPAESAPPTPAARTEAPVASAPPQPARAAAASPPSFNAAYLRNPPPRYPLIARRNGEQGTVTLRVLVTREGLPGSVALEKTSGSAALDAAAIGTVREWRFVPAQQSGQPVDAAVLVPIVFRLQDAP